jgi:hypothetical protein
MPFDAGRHDLAPLEMLIDRLGGSNTEVAQRAARCPSNAFVGARGCERRFGKRCVTAERRWDATSTSRERLASGEIELHPHDAVAERRAFDEAGPTKHGEHPLVFGEGLRDQSHDSLGPRACDEVRDEEVTDTAILPVVAHHERRFGPAVAELFEAGDPDDLLVVDRDDCLSVVMVDTGEVTQLDVREARMHAEEPGVGRVRGESCVKGIEALSVGWLDWPHRHAVRAAEEMIVPLVMGHVRGMR